MRSLVLQGIVGCLVMGVLGGPAQALTLARRGKAQCVILLANGAEAAEKTAANELAEHLKQVTGAPFAIRPAAGPAEAAIRQTTRRSSVVNGRHSAAGNSRYAWRRG